MTTINANILKDRDEATLTVTVEGDPKSPYLCRDDHPNFKLMIAAIVAGETESLPELFDVAGTIEHHFHRLSERVTVENGQVRFDGVLLDGTITEHILDAVIEGADESSYVALVNFLEKVQTNPDERSRTQLYDWIKAQDGLTITEQGDMVGYKYVIEDDTHGYRSSTAGREPVRVTTSEFSEVFTGQIPNPIDGLVEMPRNLVDSDPTRTCSVGLHVGAWNYVKNSSIILEVHVNPRDVVAVPTDYNGEKVRACRYRVVGPITQKYGQAVKHDGDTPRADLRKGERDAQTRADLDLTLQPLRDAEEGRRWKVGDRLEGGWLVGVVTVEQTGPEGYYLRFNDDSAAWFDLDDGTYDRHGDKVRRASSASKPHGKGGPTSQAAKGRGPNPAQDPATGRFVGGRPGSRRDPKTGRFG